MSPLLERREDILLTMQVLFDMAQNYEGSDHAQNEAILWMECDELEEELEKIERQIFLTDPLLFNKIKNKGLENT